MESKSYDLGKTQISDACRVSSAAIYYENNLFGDYYQYETFIFGVICRQFIHGTNRHESGLLELKTRKFHRRLCRKLINERIK